MYQVLYRKWRPHSFDDVVGQDHVTITLKNEIISGHIAHAYLFTGSRGTGKTSCARIFAKSISCLNSINGNPCGECAVCRGIDSGSLLDITEIDAASNNGVENIRSIREETFFAPSVSKYRVYIVDEVHMLSSGAFNALLKILEEPPSHVIFILATTEVHKVPATILSRCQRFDFYRISENVIAERIKYICNQEKISVDDNSCELIAKASDGALRDALSLLDQCIVQCKGDMDGQYVMKILGITDRAYIESLAKLICQKDASKAIEMLDDLYKKAKDMTVLCRELMDFFRSQMVIEISAESSHKSDKTGYLGIGVLSGYIDILQSTFAKMSRGADKRLEMEVAIISLCRVQDTYESEDIQQRLKKLENMLNNQINIGLAEKTSIESKGDSGKKRRNKEESKKDNVILENNLKDQDCSKSNMNIMDKWTDILEALKQSSGPKSLIAALKGSKAYENGNFLLIDSKNSLAFELLRESHNREEMRNIIKEVTGKQYNLGPYKPQVEKKEDLLEKFSENAMECGVDITLE